MKQTLALRMAMLVVLPCLCLGATLPVTNGLALWLKADAGVTTDAKHNVTAWLDQSEAKNNLTIVGAPALKSGAVHGLPAVVFHNGAYAKLETSVLALNWIGVYKFGTNNLSDRGTAMLGAWDQWAGFGGYHA